MQRSSTGRVDAYRELLDVRENMPDKTSEEKANLAKKLAEQRAKGVEGIPTTAKVNLDKSPPFSLYVSPCSSVFLFQLGS